MTSWQLYLGSYEEAWPKEERFRAGRRVGYVEGAKIRAFGFVLDSLTPLEPRIHPMFGCLAVYVGEKIVLMLRNKATEMQDNGVWIATTEEHHASLRREFPKTRSIQLFGGKISGWQVLPVDAPDFETAALRGERACAAARSTDREGAECEADCGCSQNESTRRACPEHEEDAE